MNRSLSFSHNNREYTVKAFQEENGWKILVYENDKLVTVHPYSVDYETDIAARMQSNPKDLVDQMMNVAKSDIEEGIVELLPYSD